MAFVDCSAAVVAAIAGVARSAAGTVEDTARCKGEGSSSPIQVHERYNIGHAEK